MKTIFSRLGRLLGSRVLTDDRTATKPAIRRLALPLFVVPLLAAPFGAAAQPLPSLLIPSDAATLSRAGVGVSAPAGAYALENNVAAMSLSERRLHAGASFGMWQPDYSGNKVIGAAATFKATRSLAVGASFKYLNSPSYDIVTESGTASRDGSFTPKEYNIALGASFAIIPCLSAGLTARVLRSSLAADAAVTVFGIDLGVSFRLKGVSAGLSVNNLGTKAKYGEGGSPVSQPMLLKAGAGYELALGKSGLGFSAEADCLFTGAFMAGASAQYGWNDCVFLRCGYHYGDSAKAVPSYASAGLGVKFFGVSLDAAWLFGSAVLKNSFGLSLGYGF